MALVKKIKHESMKISHIIIKQNYFQFQNTLYIQEEGLAMGAPTSLILSEIYLQYIEHTVIYDTIKIPYTWLFLIRTQHSYSVQQNHEQHIRHI